MTLRRLATVFSYRQIDDKELVSVEAQHEAFMLTPKATYRRFAPMYLNRMPRESELRCIFRPYDARKSPVCMGAIDCMHLHWKNFPLAYKWEYHNPKDGKLASISCQALCDSSLYCWNLFSGRCGTNNEINVLRYIPFSLIYSTGSPE